MADLPPILLNRQWEYSTDQDGWRPLSQLADWPQHALSTAGEVYLRHSIHLSPTGCCVRYLLHLETAPENTAVYVNGWQVGTTDGEPFHANITDQVSLEENVIMLKISRAGAFGRVYLQALRCD